MFSKIGDFAVTGASGADEDVAKFVGTFGSTTSGTFMLLIDSLGSIREATPSEATSPVRELALGRVSQ